jgi:hypothetical protein
VKEQGEAREWTCQWSGRGRWIRRPSGVELVGDWGVCDVVVARNGKSACGTS